MKSRLPTLVYIMAPSYTGSTLLTYLLAMHPRIATIGELKASAMGNISQYHCSCGELITDCPFWKRVTGLAKEQGLNFMLDNFGTHFRSPTPLCDRLMHAGLRGNLFEAARSLGLRLYPQCRKQFEKVLKQNLILMELIKEIQQKDIFLDGSKDPNRIKYFCESNHWNIKIIYLVRDGRGATNSYMKHNNVTMKTAAREWCIVHREADRLAEKFSEKIKRYHYEDLCSSPNEVLFDIFHFVGAGNEIVNKDFRTAEHHILGNTMRMASTSEVRIDENWKTELSKRNLEIFEQYAGLVNRKYGYLQ